MPDIDNLWPKDAPKAELAKLLHFVHWLATELQKDPISTRPDAARAIADALAILK